ncbi:hypothetical protein L218DRAFT_252537 [Marasmius fiardii PR-910]|nr:hypothetical protein L218DRAFT_252537 [Marasmius fiardii PR-910]
MFRPAYASLLRPEYIRLMHSMARQDKMKQLEWCLKRMLLILAGIHRARSRMVSRAGVWFLSEWIQQRQGFYQILTINTRGHLLREDPKTPQRPRKNLAGKFQLYLGTLLMRMAKKFQTSVSCTGALSDANFY